MKWRSLAMATKPWINLAHLRILTCIFERQGTKEHLQTLNLRICVVIISGLFMREGSLEMLSAQVHKSSQEAFSVNLAHPWPVFLAPELGAASLRFRKNTFPPPEEHKIMTWNGLNLNWIIDVSPQLCEGMDDGKIALYWNGQSCEHRAELKASWGSRLVSSGQIFLYSPFQCEPQVAWRGGWCGGKIRQSEHWCWGEQTGWWQTRGKSETFFYQSRKCKLISTRTKYSPKAPYLFVPSLYDLIWSLIL